MADFNSNLKEITEYLNDNLNKQITEDSNEDLIRPAKNKQEEIITLLAVAPLIIIGITAAATAGGVLADKVLEAKKINFNFA